MREILFRGKQLDNGEWIEGSLVMKTDPLLEISYCFILAQGRKDSFVTWHKVDPATVGQYTGMKDKNGKRIFEGDIPRIKERGYTVDGGVVFFENGYPGGWLIKAAGNESKCSLAMRTDVEVIGNIHDNPELLGGTSNG